MVRSVADAGEPRLPALLRSGQPMEAASNENDSGLLRQYFRKGADLSAAEPAEVSFAADEINGRPRSVLEGENASARFTSLQAVGRTRLFPLQPKARSAARNRG